MFQPSQYQQAIYDAVQNTKGHITIAATAGSGKTTTIIEASKLIPSYKKTIFLAFNKSIVEELKHRLPLNVEVSTIHSLGMKACAQYYRAGLTISDYKTFQFADSILKYSKLKDQDKMEAKYHLMNLHNLYRMTLSEPTIESLTNVSNKFNIECSKQEIEWAIELIAKIEEYNEVSCTDIRDKRLVDFTDMIHLPATKDMTLPKYDVVFLDECQDLNEAQQKFVKKLIKPGGRLIAVGDRRQCIYSFAGSDIASFEKLMNKPNTTVLPLSVSYRCGKKIVEFAQKVYPEIEAFEGARDGEVRKGTIDELENGDFVLCRNTKPLITLYFELIGEGKKCCVIGKDIEKNLLAMVSKVKHLDKYDGLEKLDNQLDALRNQLIENGVSKPGEHPKYQNFRDKVLVIRIVASRCRYMWEVEKTLIEIFDDSKDGIKLMTIHKSKGMETDRVFIIRPDLMPSKWAQQPWEHVQEQNLKFVAYTRAKEQLVFIDKATWSDEDDK